jgi:hypothetical protein
MLKGLLDPDRSPTSKRQVRPIAKQKLIAKEQEVAAKPPSSLFDKGVKRK